MIGVWIPGIFLVAVTPFKYSETSEITENLAEYMKPTTLDNAKSCSATVSVYLCYFKNIFYFYMLSRVWFNYMPNRML